MVLLLGIRGGVFKDNFQDEFEKLQIILGRKGKPRIAKHDFAYKEVLKCGECGGSVTAEEKYQIICSKCKTKFHKGKTTNECSRETHD